MAHLLGDCNYLIATEKVTWVSDPPAGGQTQSAYHKNDSKALEIQQRLDKLLDDKLLDDLLKSEVKHKQSITFFRGMLKLRHALFPFLYDKRIPSDNNASERAIRMGKVKLKISGQFKSLHQEFAMIRSVVGTAIKNRQSVSHAIKAMVNILLPSINR